MARYLALAVIAPLVCLAGGIVPAIAADEADESAEPPLKYSVQVGDKTVAASEGEAIQLEGTFVNPKLKITPHPFRVFPYQGVSFNYPRGYSFEADFDDPNVKIWTLTGNDFVIMFFAMDVAISAEQYAKDMVEQFGGENAKITNANAKIKLGKHEFSGVTMQATVVTQTLELQIYHLSTKGNGTRLLVFQDCLDDAKKQSKEAKETLTEIKSSFTLQP
jgi:hypothetical protein